MLTTTAVIAMVLIAAYLWRSSEVLSRLSARPRGEDDITSTGALLLLRLLCIAVLLLAVAFVATSRQPTTEVMPENMDGMGGGMAGMETLESPAAASAAQPSLMQQ